MKFRYKKYGSGILRPVIPIEIIYKDIAVPYEVLVDSGADYNIFDAQLAEILGIEIHLGKIAKQSFLPLPLTLIWQAFQLICRCSMFVLLQPLAGFF